MNNMEEESQGEPSHGKEGKTNRWCHKHSPWRGRDGGTHVGYSGRTALRRKQRDIYNCC
jgi:hypothetical protein